MNVFNEGAYIEIRGKKDLLLEGCDGIEVYTEKLISLSIGDSVLEIRGEELRLRYLAEKKIAVAGRISGVFYV